MIVTIETTEGPRKAFVCDNCRAVFVRRTERFCSGRCAREWGKYQQLKASAPDHKPAK